MPIYEYRCEKCGYQFEQLQKITDSILVICPKCGQNGLRKIISQTSFQLKGTGWYATDFKDKTKKKTEKPSEVAKEVVKDTTKKEEPKDNKNNKKDTKTETKDVKTGEKK